ncbi:rod shape-determining protein MreD [Nocardiopsis coralliicola]
MKGLLSAAVLVAAVLVQTAVVNRIPLPWGVAPDLAVVAVVAVALRSGRTSAAIGGFLTGLAVDLLPPADHEVGRYALLYCLAGYLAAAWSRGDVHSFWARYSAAATAAAGTALGYALLGAALGDPRVGLVAAALGVPATALATAVAAPLVLWPADRLLRTADPDRYAAFPALGTPLRTEGWIR